MHRNSQKRKYFEDTTYFITTVTKDRYPYFENEILCELFIEELRLCKEVKKFELYAFCIMPDHVHLLVKPGYEFNISKIIQFIKCHFSRNANILMGFNEGAVGQPRLHIDKFIKLNLNKINDSPLFQWQKSYHDHYIRNHKDYLHHYNYIINNPINDGLSENYKYISTNFMEILDI